MVIIYDKKTGDIIASFPEMYVYPAFMQVTKEGRPHTDFTHHVLQPHEAYDFENPRHPANIHDHKVVFDKNGKVIGLQRIRPTTNPKIDPKNKPLGLPPKTA